MAVSDEESWFMILTANRRASQRWEAVFVPIERPYEGVQPEILPVAGGQ